MQSHLLAVHLDEKIEMLARRTLEHAGAEMDVVQTADDAIGCLAKQRYRVVIADRDVVDGMLAVISVIAPRPVLIVIGEDRETLDPELVTMVVPPTYDAHMLVGVVLACLNQSRLPLPIRPGEGIADVC